MASAATTDNFDKPGGGETDGAGGAPATARSDQAFVDPPPVDARAPRRSHVEQAAVHEANGR